MAVAGTVNSYTISLPALVASRLSGPMLAFLQSFRDGELSVGAPGGSELAREAALAGVADWYTHHSQAWISPMPVFV